MLTPIFHPNIAPHAICIGDHWSPGEPLWSIVARIGELISYQSYNTKSPLNGEAARWVEENLDQVPLDPISMLPDEPEPAPRPEPARPAPPPRREAAAQPAVATAEPPPRINCPQCGAGLRYAPNTWERRSVAPVARRSSRSPRVDEE